MEARALVPLIAVSHRPDALTCRPGFLGHRRVSHGKVVGDVVVLLHYFICDGVEAWDMRPDGSLPVRQFGSETRRYRRRLPGDRLDAR